MVTMLFFDCFRVKKIHEMISPKKSIAGLVYIYFNVWEAQ